MTILFLILAVLAIVGASAAMAFRSAVHAILSLALAFAWRVQRATGSSGWVDTIWSAAVGIVGFAVALAEDGYIVGSNAPREIVLITPWR